MNAIMPFNLKVFKTGPFSANQLCRKRTDVGESSIAEDIADKTQQYEQVHSWGRSCVDL